MDHDWHLFNEQRRLEVRRVGDPPMYEIRHAGSDSIITTLNDEQWNRVRSGKLVILDGE